MSNTADPKTGDILEGCVLNIFEKYALVSLYAHYVGRLHNKQVTWFSNKKTVASEFTVGTNIKVIVRKVRHEIKTGNILIDLGYRELLPNPWDSVESRFPIGACTEGKIVEILGFGAIVELEGGYTGLLHDSELSWNDNNAKVSQYFSIGDNISVLVKNSDSVQHSLLLSHRETKPDPIAELIVGAKVTGKIIKFLQYGYLLELQNKCIAFLHHTEIPVTFDLAINDVLDIEIATIDFSTRRISTSLLKT